VAYVTNLSAFLTNVLALAVVVAVAVSLLKPFLEAKLKPDAPLHDAAIRWLAILLGVVFYAAISIAAGGYFSASFCVFAVLNGAIVGLTAIGAFHLLTGTYYPTLTATASESLATVTAFVPTVTTAKIQALSDATPPTPPTPLHIVDPVSKEIVGVVTPPTPPLPAGTVATMPIGDDGSGAPVNVAPAQG